MIGPEVNVLCEIDYNHSYTTKDSEKYYNEIKAWTNKR